MAAIVKNLDRFAETDVDDEVLVMRLDNGELLAMPGTAAAIWRLIDGTPDRAALLQALATEFGTEPAAIADDIDAFLRQLQDAGLIAIER